MFPNCSWLDRPSNDGLLLCCVPQGRKPHNAAANLMVERLRRESRGETGAPLTTNFSPRSSRTASPVSHHSPLSRPQSARSDKCVLPLHSEDATVLLRVLLSTSCSFAQLDAYRGCVDVGGGVAVSRPVCVFVCAVVCLCLRACMFAYVDGTDRVWFDWLYARSQRGDTSAPGSPMPDDPEASPDALPPRILPLHDSPSSAAAAAAGSVCRAQATATIGIATLTVPGELCAFVDVCGCR